ncbi:MAG: hypothetical protein WC100_04450 [Sterolibacterium sp.]
MRHLGSALVLLGMTVVAHAAAPENGLVSNEFDFPSVQIAQFNLGRATRSQSYQLSLGLVPVVTMRKAGISPYGPGLSSSYRAPVTEALAKDVAWTTNDHWTNFIDSKAATPTPFLRLETKGERIEIRPRRSSISIRWVKAFH